MKRRSNPSSVHERDQGQQIKVYVRIRPIKSQFSKRCLKVIDHGVALHFKDKIHQLYFDGVLQENATQKQVFQQSCLPVVGDVLQGKNASLFVYGQTGSGKTYTMGTLEAIKTEDQGLIPLTLKYLIEHLKSNHQEGDWSISLSFMQIYMEEIIDLLNPRNSKLQIREDLQFGQTYVEDLVIVPITNYQQSIDLINAGLQYRKVGNQKMNQLSSRSHTIFTIYISQRVSSNQFMSSTFSLIDLAGSERVKKSNSTGLRLEQAKFINTSLSALGNVISGLAENNSEKFIPYRSSKLTRILKNSLLGKSKVSVISTVETSEDNTYETYSTLLFADRCKQIRLQNQPVVNIESFQEFHQDKDMKIALERHQQKEKEYLEMIKTLQDPSRSSHSSQREVDLSQIIQSIYKLFGQINDHLKRVLQGTPKSNSPTPRRQKVQVNSNTTTQSIKSHLTSLAQQTIDHINTLSTMAFSEDGQKNNPISKQETETLTQLLLDSMRQSFKLYQSSLIKQGKESLQKQIALEEYEKQRKQEVLNKVKAKKLKNLQNTFEEVWAEHYSSSNPLQFLLNNIRRGQMGFYGEKPKKEQQQKELTNPKQFLKMLTKQQSIRRHKQMLIEDDQQRRDDLREVDPNNGSSSQIKYFQQGRTPSKHSHSDDSGGGSRIKEDAKQTNSEIKKLLDSLIASKSNFEQRKKVSTTE